MSNPNDTSELEARFAAVGRDAIQAMRIAHGMTPVRLDNVKFFTSYDEPITAHLIVRMALQGRND